MKNFSKYLPLAAIGAGLIMAKRNNGVSGIGGRMELNVTEKDLREIRELLNDGFDAYVYAGLAMGFDEADVSGYGLFKDDVKYFTMLDSKLRRGAGIPSYLQREVGQKLDSMLIMAAMAFPATQMRKVLAAINHKTTY